MPTSIIRIAPPKTVIAIGLEDDRRDLFFRKIPLPSGDYYLDPPQYLTDGTDSQLH